MEDIFRHKVKKKIGYETVTGFVTINENFFIFEPTNKAYKIDKIPLYRIVQTGFRKFFQFFAYKFYFKTSSGSVFYYLSPNSKKIVKVLEKLVY